MAYADLSTTTRPARAATGGHPRNVGRQTVGRQTVGSLLLTLLLINVLVIGPLLTWGGGELDASVNVEASKPNIINQILWISLIAGNVAAVLHYGCSPRVFVALWPVALYLAWSLASVAWATEPGIVLRRLILQVLVVGSVVTPMALIDDTARAMRVIFAVFLGCLLLNAGVVAVQTPSALGYQGIFHHKNNLGAAAALGIIVCLAKTTERRWLVRGLAWLGLLVGGVLLVVSQSKTSLGFGVLMPLAALAVVVLSRTTRVAPGLLTVLLAIIAGSGAVLAGGLLNVQVDDVLNAVFGDTTFTGRTDIWRYAWSQFLQQPLIGYGFNGFWGIGASTAALDEGGLLVIIVQAHNGYLDIALETGVVGFLLFLAILGVGLSRLRLLVTAVDPSALFATAVFFFFIAHNFLESSAFRRVHFVWVVFLVALSLTALARRPSRRKES